MKRVDETVVNVTSRPAASSVSEDADTLFATPVNVRSRWRSAWSAVWALAEMRPTVTATDRAANTRACHTFPSKDHPSIPRVAAYAALNVGSHLRAVPGFSRLAAFRGHATISTPLRYRFEAIPVVLAERAGSSSGDSHVSAFVQFDSRAQGKRLNRCSRADQVSYAQIW